MKEDHIVTRLLFTCSTIDALELFVKIPVKEQLLILELYSAAGCLLKHLLPTYLPKTVWYRVVSTHILEDIYILEELKCFEQREWNSNDFDAVVWLLCHTWLGYPLHVGQVLSSPLYSGQRDAIISHHDHYTFRARSSPLSKLIKKVDLQPLHCHQFQVYSFKILSRQLSQCYR